MVNLDSNSTRAAAEQIVNDEVTAVDSDPSIIKGNGCAACHVLFTMKDKMKISEQDAADLLSGVLLDNNQLNDRFIEMVENIHMKQRRMGTAFAMKNREAKDRYIDSNFKNTLDELLADATNYGVEIVMRRLILSHIALQIAQTVGIDYHAATEELYYYMRKKDQESHEELLKLVKSLIERAGRNKV